MIEILLETSLLGYQSMETLMKPNVKLEVVRIEKMRNRE